MKNQKKRIVIDARIRRSSTGRYVDRLMEHLQDIDEQNRYIVVLQNDDDWLPRKPNFEVTYSNCPQFSINPLHEIVYAIKLYGLKADLVHFPMNQQPMFYFKPVVTSTLDLTMLSYTRPGKTPLPIFYLKMAGYKFIFWYSNRKSKQIITISNYVKKDLESNYRFTNGKTTTTYCATEPPIEVTPKAPKFIKQNQKFLLYVGTALPHKNLESLIYSFIILRKTHPSLKLVLAGKKEYYYDKLVDYTKSKDISKDVVISGFVSDEVLKWLYENAICYVFPSLSEGFGLPGLEAMAHGLPVVSSNATCLPEIYSDAAIYFDPLDIEDMSEKIDKVISDKKLRNKLIKKGCSQIKKYSWEKMDKETLAVYEKTF